MSKTKQLSETAALREQLNEEIAALYQDDPMERAKTWRRRYNVAIGFTAGVILCVAIFVLLYPQGTTATVSPPLPLNTTTAPSQKQRILSLFPIVLGVCLLGGSFGYIMAGIFLPKLLDSVWWRTNSCAHWHQQNPKALAFNESDADGVTIETDSEGETTV